MRLSTFARQSSRLFFGLVGMMVMVATGCQPPADRGAASDHPADTVRTSRAGTSVDSNRTLATEPSGDPDVTSNPESEAQHNGNHNRHESDMPDAIEAKLDAPLRQALARGSQSRLQVFLELSTAPTDSQIDALMQSGLEDVSPVGRIVTATGSPESIRQAAGLDFVRSLSLSRDRPALE